MTSQMVGFIVGIFVGAVVGIIILALANASQLDEITDATTVVSEEKVCSSDPEQRKLYDITPEMAMYAWNVIKDYTLETDSCDTCIFRDLCDASCDTFCEMAKRPLIR